MFPIDFFWRACLRWPDRIAIDTPNGSITYKELARKVKALAGGLVLLPFERKFAEHERGRNLEEKLLAKADGILET